jgi:hypothetical protein
VTIWVANAVDDILVQQTSGEYEQGTHTWAELPLAGSTSLPVANKDAVLAWWYDHTVHVSRSGIAAVQTPTLPAEVTQASVVVDYYTSGGVGVTRPVYIKTLAEIPHAMRWVVGWTRDWAPVFRPARPSAKGVVIAAPTPWGTPVRANSTPGQRKTLEDADDAAALMEWAGPEEQAVHAETPTRRLAFGDHTNGTKEPPPYKEATEVSDDEADPFDIEIAEDAEEAAERARLRQQAALLHLTGLQHQQLAAHPEKLDAWILSGMLPAFSRHVDDGMSKWKVAKVVEQQDREVQARAHAAARATRSPRPTPPPTYHQALTRPATRAEPNEDEPIKLGNEWVLPSDPRYARVKALLGGAPSLAF